MARSSGVVRTAAATWGRVYRRYAGIVCVALALPPGTSGAPSARTPSLPGQGGNFAVAASPQPAQGSSQETGTGVIRGRVLRADTGAPLPRADVLVTTADIPRAATTDDRGIYEIRSLPPGRYTVTASKAGYVTKAYGGQRTATAIDLAARQVVGSIDLTLTRAATVEGRVIDQHGEPAIEAGVSLYPWRPVNGLRYVVGANTYSVSTDDLGRFRIYGLDPDTYYLEVLPRNVNSEDLRPTYYPGTLALTEAQPIDVTAGQELSGITLQLASGRLATLSATVMTSDGQPARLGSVSLIGAMWRGVLKLGAGSFSIGNIAPGTYTLLVRADNAEAVTVPVTVGDADLTVALVTRPGGTVRGRIVFEPERPPGITPQDVRFNVLLAAGSHSGARVEEDWTLTAANVVGTGVIQAIPRALGPDNVEPWVLKGVFHRGEEITDTPVDFTNGADDLEVVLTTRVPRITGTVTDQRGTPVRAAVVVVFPEERARWGTSSRSTKTARLNQSGVFTLAVPPGRYFIVAVDYLAGGDERDVQVLERLRRDATAITVGEGELKTLSLRLAEP